MAERNRSTWASARSGGGPFPEGFQVPPRCLDVPETQPGEQRGHLLRSESTQEERLHLPGNPGGLLPPRAAEEPVIDPVDRRRMAIERGEQRGRVGGARACVPRGGGGGGGGGGRGGGGGGRGSPSRSSSVTISIRDSAEIVSIV